MQCLRCWSYDVLGVEKIAMIISDTIDSSRVRYFDEPLTAEQVSEFHREGFLVLDKAMIPESELTACRAILMSMITGGKGRSEGRNIDLIARDGGEDVVSPSVLQPSMYSSQLRGFAYRKTALAIARQLMGPKAEFAGDHTIFKPSHNGGATPWHQDEAFRDPGFEYKEISIWIAMTASTPENGAMAYIPRSHLRGVLPHRLNGGSKQANTIECCAGFDPAEAAIRPIPAGAMIIHDARTVHGAVGNRTSASRLAYILQYATPVKLSKQMRDAPWLEHLRSANLQSRKHFLLRGGIFPELWRLMLSDRHSHRHFLSFLWRRAYNRMRKQRKSI
jgi:ectoine hydroxylase-related dioxygenase (phytanoyl-CoA dioxygenase family)